VCCSTSHPGAQPRRFKGLTSLLAADRPEPSPRRNPETPHLRGM
jgi:hypothetical protein